MFPQAECMNFGTGGLRFLACLFRTISKTSFGFQTRCILRQPFGEDCRERDMATEFELVAGAGRDHYSIIVTIRDLKPLAAAGAKLEARGLGAEGLLAALLETSKGNIIAVDRYKDGKLNDAPGGIAASQRYYPDGALLRESRFVQGHLSDNMEFGYADCEYYPSGRVKQQTRANLGLKQDGSSGMAALQVFTEEGRLQMLQRFNRGELSNSAKGDPAVEIFNADGTLAKAFNAKGGKLLAELTPAEVTELQQRRQDMQSLQDHLPQLKLKSAVRR